MIDVGKDLQMAFEDGYQHGKRDAQRWIPCSERLPEENKTILLGIRYKDDFKYFVTARIDFNYWVGLGRDVRGELRWCELPEPWL